jgi:hypothetical protein
MKIFVCEYSPSPHSAGGMGASAALPPYHLSPIFQLCFAVPGYPGQVFDSL